MSVVKNVGLTAGMAGILPAKKAGYRLGMDGFGPGGNCRIRVDGLHLHP